MKHECSQNGKQHALFRGSGPVSLQVIPFPEGLVIVFFFFFLNYCRIAKLMIHAAALIPFDLYNYIASRLRSTSIAHKLICSSAIRRLLRSIPSAIPSARLHGKPLQYRPAALQLFRSIDTPIRSRRLFYN
jgi:hypothetical protein